MSPVFRPPKAPPAPAATVPRGHRVGFALGVVAAQTLLFLLGFALLGLVAGSDNPFAPKPMTFLTCLLVELLQAALMVWLVLVRLGGLGLQGLGWTFERPARSLAEGAVGFAAAALLLLLLLAAAGGDPLAEARSWVLDASLADRALWLLIGLGVPITEESVFRGSLQPALVRKLGRPAGVAVTALVFSLYHLPRTPLAFAGRLLSGLVFGVLRERTQGLLAPWFAHLLMWLVIGTR